MDIEGSEFSLFKSMQCLKRVKYIALEVHPQFGDPQQLIDKLIQNNFIVKLKDGDLNPTNTWFSDRLFYIYAYNPAPTDFL